MKNRAGKLAGSGYGECQPRRYPQPWDLSTHKQCDRVYEGGHGCWFGISYQIYASGTHVGSTRKQERLDYVVYIRSMKNRISSTDHHERTFGDRSEKRKCPAVAGAISPRRPDHSYW